MNNPACKYCQT